MASMVKRPVGYALRRRARDDFDAVYALTTRIALARHGEADFTRAGIRVYRAWDLYDKELRPRRGAG
jgi:hypothetical protein